jgi:hypothetical protein
VIMITQGSIILAHKEICNVGKDSANMCKDVVIES